MAANCTAMYAMSNPRHLRKHSDPLLRKWRICGLRKARIPLQVPGIEPVMNIMGGKEDMEVCVVGLQRQLHQQKRQVNHQSRHENEV